MFYVKRDEPDFHTKGYINKLKNFLLEIVRLFLHLAIPVG